MARKRISRWLKRRGFYTIARGVNKQRDFVPYYIRWPYGVGRGHRITYCDGGWQASHMSYLGPVLPTVKLAYMHAEVDNWGQP